MVAGAIIGKGGETIAQLQKDTGARVKMSKSHDFYPGKWNNIFLDPVYAKFSTRRVKIVKPSRPW